MANIVELREMSDDKLEEMLENSREEIFNLRFRQASAQLEDYSRLKSIRREVAQLETVLSNRQLAINTAVLQNEIASALASKEWTAASHFDYKNSIWQVTFMDAAGKDIATAAVNLNKKRSKKRSSRQNGQPELVTNYKIVG
jgi:large subunit ribosomal protein L29